MKVPYTLTALAFLALPSVLHGQSLISSGAFFNPDIRAQHAFNAAPSLTLDVVVDTANVSNSANAGVSPNVAWNHNVSGYVGANLLFVASAHIAPFTETSGDSLVFGRQLSATLLGGDLGSVLTPLLNTNALTTWSSSAVISGINIAANQLYQVSFNVTPGSNLPLGVLDSASFGITSPGIEDSGGNASGLVNVLGLVTVGSSLTNGVATLTFQSDVARTDLALQFQATSAVGVGLLGNTQGNAEVLTFSNFTVTPVPEPSVSLLGAAAAGLMLTRRRRA